MNLEALSAELREEYAEIFRKPLYRYLWLCHGEELNPQIENLLGRDILDLSRPTTFNDPFDCDLPLDYSGSDGRWMRFMEAQAQARRETKASGKRNFREMLAKARKSGGRTKFYQQTAKSFVADVKAKAGIALPFVGWAESADVGSLCLEARRNLHRV
jgi:hypothetical protein